MTCIEVWVFCFCLIVDYVPYDQYVGGKGINLSTFKVLDAAWLRFDER